MKWRLIKQAPCPLQALKTPPQQTDILNPDPQRLYEPVEEKQARNAETRRKKKLVCVISVN